MIGRRALLAASVVASSLHLASPARADDGFSFERIAGTDRYSTAAAVALALPDAGTAAIVATGESHADALAAAHLAGARSAPVLLTARDSVPAATSDALRRLGTRTITVLGGPGAVSHAVVESLGAAGYSVDRLAGSDRFETARLVAEAAGAGAVGELDGARTAILAGGAGFADAIAAGPLAHAAGLPVLLTPAATLAPAARAALQSLDIERVLIVGGAAAVGAAVEAELSALGLDVDRLAGADRAATAVEIADFALASADFTDARVNLARGDGYADALAGGPLGGSLDTVTLLSATSTSLGSATREWLRAHEATLTGGAIFGGSGAISPAVESDARSAGGGAVSAGAGGTAEGLTVAITGGLADGASTADTTPTYTGTASASNGAVSKVTAAVDGKTASTVRCEGCGTAHATWEYTPKLEEGAHAITFTAFDASGAPSSPARTSLTVDLTAPTFLGITASRGATVVPAEFNEPMRCASAESADFAAEVDGGDVIVREVRCAGTSSTTIEVVLGRALAAGEELDLELVGEVTDAAGNVAVRATRSAGVVNDGAPEVVVTSPSSGAHVRASRPRFDGEATGGTPVSRVEVRFDSQAFTTNELTCTGCPSNAVTWWYRSSTITLTEGAHVFEARARDESGVYSTVAKVPFTVDTVVPVYESVAAVAGSTVVKVTFADVNGIDCATPAAQDFVARIDGALSSITAVSCRAFDPSTGKHVVDLTLGTAPPAGSNVSVELRDATVFDRAGNPAGATTRTTPAAVV